MLKKILLFIIILSLLPSIIAEENITAPPITGEATAPPPTPEPEPEPCPVCVEHHDPQLQLLAPQAYYDGKKVIVSLKVILKDSTYFNISDINLTIFSVIDLNAESSAAEQRKQQGLLEQQQAAFYTLLANFTFLREAYDERINNDYIITYDLKDIIELKEKTVDSLQRGSAVDANVYLKLFTNELNVFDQKIRTAPKKTYIQWLLQNASSIVAVITLSTLAVAMIVKTRKQFKKLKKETEKLLTKKQKEQLDEDLKEEPK
ncbi:MAG: hypothetical protein Q7R96_04405 [Nanoarchaeota archaeon]|nr:hypothetical protein [Nanoarchaeota archaeon]